MLEQLGLADFLDGPTGAVEHVHPRLRPGAFDRVPHHEDESHLGHGAADEPHPVHRKDAVRGRDLALHATGGGTEEAAVCRKTLGEVLVEEVEFPWLRHEQLRMALQVRPQPGGARLLRADPEEVGESEHRGDGTNARQLLLSAAVRGDKATTRQVAACAIALAFVGTVLFGGHVDQAGRYSDDWALAAEFRFEADGQYWTMVDRFQDRFGGRPLLAPSVAAIQALWPADLAAQHAVAVLLGAIASLLFFVLLRAWGLATAPAIGAALLSLIAPWGDANRLWVAAAPSQLCVIFYLAGFLVALAGLRTETARGPLLHAAAVACYLLALLVYEGAALLMLATGLAYVVAVGWRRARLRWAADVAVILPALLVLSTLHHHTPSVRAYLSGLRDLPARGATVVLEALVPLPVGSWGCALILAGVAVGVWLAARPLAPAERRRLQTPIAAIGASVIALGLAWAPFVGAGLPPTAPGVDNRGNLLAAFVLPLLVLGLAWLGARLAAARTDQAQAWAGATTAVIVTAAIGVGWAVIARSHASAYERSDDGQHRVLITIASVFTDRPPPGTTLYTTGHAAQAAAGVPVFSETWDLDGAVKLLFDDGSLRAFPIVGPARLTCSGERVVPDAPAGSSTAMIELGYGDEQGAAYGRAVLVDVTARRLIPIDDHRSCRDAAGVVGPGG